MLPKCGIINVQMPRNYDDPVVSAIKRVQDAVVSIAVTKELPEEITKQLPIVSPGGMPFPTLPNMPKDLLPKEHDRVQIGGGSGFIVSPDGLVLTNKHVVRDPDATYSVVLSNEKVVPAKIVSRDPVNDIAVLQISVEEDLPTTPLGDSKTLELGETLIAIGNALGTFKNTVSVGVVSGLARFLSAQDGIGGGIAHLRGLIQTDAAINPGNSGGPLVNTLGEAIGINVATVMGAENIGFAIPINAARRDLEDIESFGRIRKPFFGVRYLVIDKDTKEQFGLPAAAGAYIAHEDVSQDAIIAESPAEKAGLQEKDIIIRFDNVPLSEKITLQDILENCRVGETVSIEFLRGGKHYETEVTLQERPGE